MNMVRVGTGVPGRSGGLRKDCLVARRRDLVPKSRDGSGRIVRVSWSEGVERALDRIPGFLGFTGFKRRTTKRLPGGCPPTPRLRRINRSSWYGQVVRVSLSRGVGLGEGVRARTTRMGRGMGERSTWFDQVVRVGSSEWVETALDRIPGFLGFTGFKMRTTQRLPGGCPPTSRLRRINRSTWFEQVVRVSLSRGVGLGESVQARTTGIGWGMGSSYAEASED